jgi:diguanylate cyclase
MDSRQLTRTRRSATAVALPHVVDQLAAVSADLRGLASALLAPQERKLDDCCAGLVQGALASSNMLDQLTRPIGHVLERLRDLELALFESRLALIQARAALSRLKASEHEAQRRARLDSLTRLPNQTAFRTLLDLTLSRAAQSQTPVAVLYLDLDNFKLINDAHGHDVGDALLCIVAARLRSSLRTGDTVGRLGGDEFAFLLANPPDRATLAARVSRLAMSVMAPIQIGALDLTVRASVGIATWPDDGDCSDELLRHADRAMYEAKRQRSGHAFFHHDLDAGAVCIPPHRHPCAPGRHCAS